MQAIVLSLFLFGQTDLTIPPPPAPAEPTTKSTAPRPGNLTGAATLPAYPLSASFEDMKSWLLARIVVDNSLDANKAVEVSRMIDTMNEGQMRVLIAAYRDRMATLPDVPKQTIEERQRQIIEQANSNKQSAEARRDNLKREFETPPLANPMSQMLYNQNLMNVQMMYNSTSPITFGYGGYPFAYGYGYPGFNPGVYSMYGYGVPAYGSSMFYSGPAYGVAFGIY